jgi:hypothetical protein
MWRNPKYYPADATTETTAAPVESGQRLLTLPRARGAEELRLNLDVYEGHEYLALRIWRRGEDGSWWPSQKGLSVRMCEAGALAKTLAEVAESRPQRPEQAPARAAAGRGGEPPRRPPAPATTGGEFSEF